MAATTKSVYRVLLHGPDEAGKSKILFVLSRGGYQDHYDPTFHEVTNLIATVDDKEYNLEMHDVGGGDHFAKTRQPHLSNAQIFIFVYDLTRRQSFADVSACYDEVLQQKGGSKPLCILVGSKLDEIEADPDERRVPKEDAEALAQKWNAPYIECSAQNGTNLQQVLEAVVSVIKKENVTPLTPSNLTETPGLRETIKAAEAKAEALQAVDGSGQVQGAPPKKKGVAGKLKGVFGKKKKNSDD